MVALQTASLPLWWSVSSQQFLENSISIPTMHYGSHGLILMSHGKMSRCFYIQMDQMGAKQPDNITSWSNVSQIEKIVRNGCTGLIKSIVMVYHGSSSAILSICFHQKPIFLVTEDSEAGWVDCKCVDYLKPHGDILYAPRMPQECSVCCPTLPHQATYLLLRRTQCSKLSWQIRYNLERNY